MEEQNINEENLAETGKTFTKIYNLSNRRLNEVEKSVLLMGLKFTPTPEKNNPREVNDDVTEFVRKIRLLEYFSGVENKDVSLVKNKSNFTPPNGRNESLDTYAATTKSFCSMVSKENKQIKHNITLDQRNAIKSLAQDNSIIIKEADKGGGIVIMNTDFYKGKILKILTDENYYQSVPDSNIREIFSKINNLIKDHKNLTKNEIDFLLKFDSKTSTFYGLPKIHKSKIIHDACNIHKSEYVEVLNPDDLQFRPIVAGPRCETSHLSSLLDVLLKPFLTKIESYLKDGIHFLNSIPKKVSENTRLISFDIVSLYSNIPHGLGLEAISFWLDRYPDLIADRFNKSFIIEALKIILENNIFSFNKDYFKQTKGTAMGTKVAPTYATLVLAFLEEKLYEKIKTEKDENFAIYIRKEWKRYLDDCFMFWERSMSDLVYFESVLNSLHEDIQFKMQQSTEKLPFLDVMVIKNGTAIITDIYFKTTDSKQYLNFKSCHPKPTKANIPYSLARRICTIVSDLHILQIRLHELATILIDRKYPWSVIKEGISRALQIPRNTLLNTQKEVEENLTPFISTFNPKNREVFGILKTNMDIFSQDERMKNIMENTKIIKGKRQLPNLRRILINSEFRENKTQPCVSKCNEPRCGLCKNIIEGSSLQLKQKTFHVREDMNCTVQNVLYVLVCNGCNEFYIGQTGDKLRNRKTVHEQQIRDPSTRQMPLSSHVDNCCKTEPKFSMFPFYKFHKNDVSARLTKERYFIDVFKPNLNAL
ncbi:MAG: GIY-YIG nuclease family protein [Candidatus Thiodiazotropha endolucinida]|nr:GIY-YIG nuclease family protein [Candidatus Thiodiazotropha taylori]MCW4259843.1 GIY-YIG nuclease family protein [Candidatus Thiodiazotropha endolucinida]